MSSLLLHPGDLSLSQWVLLFFVWVVAPIVILYFIFKRFGDRKGGRKR
jgi:hypothetical protein